MAAESLDLFDLERIKEIREEDITLPPRTKTLCGRQGCIDAGLTAAARNLLVEIKKGLKEVHEFEGVIAAIVEKDEGDENAADHLNELDGKYETLDRLVARFNKAISKVPSSVLEKVKKKKDKEFPSLDFLATVVKPMCNEMMAPLPVTTTTASIMPPPPPIVPVVKRVPSRKKEFIKRFNPDYYSTNKKSCDYDDALSKETCFELFEFFETCNNEKDLHGWYQNCTNYICHRTLVAMWKRWGREKAGEDTTRDDELNKGCCYYKHPLMWASLKEAWGEFCELA